MRYHILAADYDGTLAEHGTVAASTIDALKRLRDSGRRLVLVTGRRLERILDIFPPVSLFEKIVAENGALLYDPETSEETLLVEPPPAQFAEELRRRGVDRLETGRAIVATWVPFETVALDVIREMGLDLQIIFNKDAVMILPSGMNKAAGLRRALLEIGVSPVNTVAVGDAQNDEVMLRLCGASAAVDNALQPVKDIADIVLQKPRGAGVEQLIDMILESDLAHLREIDVRGLTLGARLDGRPFSIAEYGESLLVTGTPGGGKSKFAISVLEQLTARGEQCCIIDPEGDYPGIDNAVTLGNSERAPSIDEVIGVLKQPAEHCIVSLFAVEKEDRPSYFDRLHRALAEMRSRCGRPHWMIVDEAHYAAPRGWEPAKRWNPIELEGYIFISAFHDELSDVVLQNVKWFISIASDPHQAIVEIGQRIGEECSECVPPEDQQIHKALAWRRGNRETYWFSRIAPRVDGRRHLHSYYNGEMEEALQFVFRGPDSKLNLPTANLKQFIKTANGVDDETWQFHLSNHDYSKWLREVVKDLELASEVEVIERTQSLSAEQSRQHVVHHIEQRFKPKW